MHQTVEQALALIHNSSRPRVVHTHRPRLPHAETNARLVGMGYPHVQLAYDGLEFEVPALAPMKSHASTAIQVYREPPWEERGQRDYQLFRLPGPGRPAMRFATPALLAIGNYRWHPPGIKAILRANRRARSRPHMRSQRRHVLIPRREKCFARRLRRPGSQQRSAYGVVQPAWPRSRCVLPFTLDLARLSPGEFVEQILVCDLHVKAVLVGEISVRA